MGQLELFHGAGMVKLNTGIELLVNNIPDFSCIFNKEFSLTVIQRFCFFIIFPACDPLVRGVVQPHLLLLTVVEHGEGLHDHGCPVVQAEALVHLPPSRDVVEVDEVCVLEAILLESVLAC